MHPLPSVATHPALTALCGRVLESRYRLDRILGAGGMGAVFEATQLRLDRKVAIKVIRPAFAGHEEFIKRFLREATAASMLDHPNVVEIIDFGETTDGLVYSVMKFLPGQDLEAYLRAQPDERLPWADAYGFLIQIAAGLKAAHERGIIHRDIKPANCFLTISADAKPLVKVLDFGIAKVEDAADQGQPLTGAGEILGTPAYIAPEILRYGVPANPRSDIYSFGVLAYRMLTGRVPFTGANQFDLVQRVCLEPVPSLSARAPDLPPAVESMVLSLLAKNPDERPSDMLAVREAMLALGRDALDPMAPDNPFSAGLAIDSSPSEVVSESVNTAPLPVPAHERGVSLMPLLEKTEALIQTGGAAHSDGAVSSTLVLHAFGSEPPYPEPKPSTAPASAPGPRVNVNAGQLASAIDEGSLPASRPGPGGPRPAQPIPATAGRTAKAVLHADRPPHPGQRHKRLLVAGLLTVLIVGGISVSLAGGTAPKPEEGGVEAHPAPPPSTSSTQAAVPAHVLPSAPTAADANENALPGSAQPEPSIEPEPELSIESEPSVDESTSSVASETRIKPTKTKSGSAKLATKAPTAAVTSTMSTMAPIPQPEPERPLSVSLGNNDGTDESTLDELERLIKTECSKKMAGEAVNLAFRINSRGQAHGLIITSASTDAVDCAEQQIRGFSFPSSMAGQKPELVVR